MFLRCIYMILNNYQLFVDSVCGLAKYYQAFAPTCVTPKKHLFSTAFCGQSKPTF